MAINALAIDFLDIFREKLGDIFIGTPIDRNTKLVTVFFFKSLLQIGSLEPVVTKPVKIRKLLVGQLPDFAIRPCRKRYTNEIFDIEHRVGHRLAFARHPIGKIDSGL